MTDLTTAIADETAHDIRLARNPGFRDYIVEKVKRMAKWQPAMYGHLPQAVAVAIKEDKPNG